MQLVRSLDILQPDFQWQYQLRHERDITAQVEAVRSLERYPTPGNKVFIFYRLHMPWQGNNWTPRTIASTSSISSPY